MIFELFRKGKTQLYNNPMNNKNQTKESYNQSAQMKISQFNNLGARVSDINKALSHISKENPFILELGCGSGRDAAEILKRTSNYVGIDYSEKFVDECRKNVSKEHFQVADMETYTFPSGIDAIFAFASLLHSDKEAVSDILSKAYEALNNGGVFFISLKHGDYTELLKYDEAGFRTFYFYTPELIKELAPKGFETVYENIQNFNGQEWFTIILRKKGLNKQAEE